MPRMFREGIMGSIADYTRTSRRPLAGKETCLRACGEKPPFLNSCAEKPISLSCRTEITIAISVIV